MKWKKENNCISDEILQCFLDEELVKQMAEQVEKHISECESCLYKSQEKRNFKNVFVNEFPAIDENEITIPEFKPMNPKVMNLQKRKIFYLWSAAAGFLLLLSVLAFYDFGGDNIETEYVFQEMNTEIDANIPWYEQSSTIYILNESGEIIDKIENL